MFRGIDDSEVPIAAGTSTSEDPLKGVFQRRIEEERRKRESTQPKSSWDGWVASPEQTQSLKEEARAKRDEYV